MAASAAANESPVLTSASTQRPLLDRMPSTFGDTPVATNSVVNRQASASSSLYQNCRAVLDRLDRVPGFTDRFANTDDENEAHMAISTDPVSRSLQMLRLGASLCFLFNAFELDRRLEVNPQATMLNLKACQKGTAHFVMACKQDLKFPDTDLFAIHELYGQDTNGVVKVINTVTKVLNLLEQQGRLLPPKATPAVPLAPAGPSDERSMIVREILDSERKYVQDLEVLQDYQRQVQANDIITQDQIHNLFLNLNTLCDFQRRFLIGVEANASRPPEEQRFGHLFLQMEDHFAVYEPYCSNLTAAQDLAIVENTALSKLSHVLDPISELAPLLIKPVQRICKYPLLLGQLVKNTPETSPYYLELQAGHAAIMRVTDRVNETKRREDMRQAVLDLASRVDDWKGHDINSFGELLLMEPFAVIKNDTEREYIIYLFERIILCCKEAPPNPKDKKNSKSNSMIRRPTPTSSTRRPTMLLLKGRIFINNVTGAVPSRVGGQCLLDVRWRGDVAEEAFTMRCRTEELLKQWQRTITKAVEEAPLRRRQAHLSGGRRSERGMNSPISQFPQTPMTEFSPSVGSSGYAFGSDWNSSQASSMGVRSSNPYANEFEDDLDENYQNQTESGRSTPSLHGYSGSLPRRAGAATRSLPAEQRGALGDPSNRPRAQTQDSSSALINEWRSQTPSLPRGAASAYPNGAGASGSNDRNVRPSASNHQLRSQQSTEWGSAYPRAPGQNDPDGHDHGNRPSLRQQSSAAPMQRQGSYGTTAPPQAPGMLRNRSASSPNMHHQQQQQFGAMPISSSSQAADQEWSSRSGAPSHPYACASTNGGGNIKKQSGATNSGASTLASQSSASTHQKRFSSSSNHTDRSSNTSNTSAGPIYSNATSPVSNAPLPPLPHEAVRSHAMNGNGSSVPSSAVRVKVTYSEDTFVVVVLATVSYAELLDKVLKKIRLCGRTLQDASSLRLKYLDEDGDKIAITSDEDVLMAMEDVRNAMLGSAGHPTLTLFANVD
ncbi:BQ2448_7847 [Microbotryum intermedium]|uniref:BQ2448_7847 protein n=1 Tax=Microbotryum intermedium TaxID=269621 RepID=A0A238FUB9_9BASI|nr:BQ2448_7847 [Microbotryum intermedium]